MPLATETTARLLRFRVVLGVAAAAGRESRQATSKSEAPEDHTQTRRGCNPRRGASRGITTELPLRAMREKRANDAEVERPPKRAEGARGETIWRAVDEDDTETLHKLIEADPLSFDVDMRNGRRSTLLHKTAGRGSIQVVELLLQSGADANLRNHQDWTSHRCQVLGTTKSGNPS